MRKLLTITLACFLLTAAGTANAGFTFVNSHSWDGDALILDNVLNGLYGSSNLTRINDSVDQVWVETDGGATAVAKYAGHTHRLGYSENDGLSVIWFSPNPFLTGSSSGTFNTSGSFVWELKDKNTGCIWYSDQSLNENSWDHMVTFKITGNTGYPANTIGNYVICWEDLNLGDKDYQDLVVEVSECVPIPAPAAILLGSIGVCIVGWLRRRRTL